MRSLYLIASLLAFSFASTAQTTLRWKLADTGFGPLPQGMHVYTTSDSLNGQPFRAAYAVVPMRNRSLDIFIDTGLNRRLTPDSFYKRRNKPPYTVNHLVVNLGYFNFNTNRSTSLLLQNGNLIAPSEAVQEQKKPKTGYLLPARGAIAFFRNRRADVAWVYTDDYNKRWMAMESPIAPVVSDNKTGVITYFRNGRDQRFNGFTLPTTRKWKEPVWAAGAGPVVVQSGAVYVTNEQEIQFAGKAINDRHPRTAMGYTANRDLIVMVIEGRNPNAAGATLTEVGQLMVQAGCVEALNMDGGGSSCMLINGKPAIQVSDKTGQRPVPAVLVVQHQ